MTASSRIEICEVGPRDGLQSEPRLWSIEERVEMIDRLSATGLPRIEAVSFVNPKRVPQMADAREVLQQIQRANAVRYTVLVPNTTGAELAVEEDIDGIRLVVCASETFNQRNVRMSVDDSVRECEAIVEIASRRNVPAEVAIGVAFACPFEGPTSEDRVLELAPQLGAECVHGLRSVEGDGGDAISFVQNQVLEGHGVSSTAFSSPALG